MHIVQIVMVVRKEEQNRDVFIARAFYSIRRETMGTPVARGHATAMPPSHRIRR
jgi:hypothetical protein